MGNIYKEINKEILQDLPNLFLSPTQIKISGVKSNSQTKSAINVSVLVEIYSYYTNSVIRKITTNNFGYYEFLFDKKDLSIGKYEVRYFGTGYRSELKPLGDWDVIEITKEMLINGIPSFTNIIGVLNIKAFSNDGQKFGTIDGEHIMTNTIQLVWDDFRIMKPESFPLNVEDSNGNAISLSYEQALSIDNYIVFMFVSDAEISSPPHDYPVDTEIPSRWFLATKTKLSEANVFLPNEKYFAFWVGGYINENIFTKDLLDSPLPESDFQRIIY